ncbi:MAG: hypothetical protein WCP29_18400 [Acidobacteriota bacterium]
MSIVLDMPRPVPSTVRFGGALLEQALREDAQREAGRRPQTLDELMAERLELALAAGENPPRRRPAAGQIWSVADSA